MKTSKLLNRTFESPITISLVMKNEIFTFKLTINENVITTKEFNNLSEALDYISIFEGENNE